MRSAISFKVCVPSPIYSPNVIISLGVGGCVKRSVCKHVLSGKVVISTPDGFATYANDIVNGITVICMCESEVPEEPEEVDDIPYIKGMQTLQVHKVQRFVSWLLFSQILLSCL